mmetsp:Transcript_33022/g.58137  ORF Transcript_33022/g.58137 Transcript_33022/m.58137 type:complete len:264 (+) Transcript_33022:1393-2184(+)
MFEIVKYLIEEAGASLEVFRQTMALLRRTPLDVICEQGHTKLLKYMLPLLEKTATEDSETIKLHQSEDQTLLFPSTYTAVQRAAEKGHTSILMYICEYYRARKAPIECDIHYVDDISGENCALLASRSGKAELIRYLHEECRANFSVVNKRGESALQLAAVGSKKNPKGSFLDCFRYLCEVVKVDVNHEHEETLLLLEDPKLISYVEKRLKLSGLSVTKSSLEQKYAPAMPVQSQPSQGQFQESDLSSIAHVARSQDLSELGF